MIEEMWVKFSYDTDISLYSEIPESIEELMDYHDFKQAIQTACKAQRNACAKVYNKHYGDSEHYDECCGLEIFTAEIERCDYE